MLVTAKCIARAWDNNPAREYLPGFEYEIDSDSPLASLTVTPVAYDDKGNTVSFYQDHEGKIKSRPAAKPAYVFDFDRNATRTKDGVVVVMDYTCKECGEPCKSLAELGRHSYSKHTVGEKEPEVFADRTCADCGKVCKSSYGLRLHREKFHVETKQEAHAVA